MKKLLIFKKQLQVTILAKFILFIYLFLFLVKSIQIERKQFLRITINYETSANDNSSNLP